MQDDRQSSRRSASFPVFCIETVVPWCAAVIAAAFLVMQYGGFAPRDLPVSRDVIAAAGIAAIVLYAATAVFRMVSRHMRDAYIVDNWQDLVAATVLAGAALLSVSAADILGAAAVYLLVSRCVPAAILFHDAVCRDIPGGRSARTAALFVAYFIVLCALGTALLLLPAAIRPAYRGRWYFDNAFFTATAGTCTTGLTVADPGTQFTPFGQAVLLTLIQLGGLGTIVFGTVLALRLGILVRPSSHETLSGDTEHLRTRMRRIVSRAILFCLAVEIAGAVFLMTHFADPAASTPRGDPTGPAKCAWHGVFHSISAFCNAGVSLYPENLSADAGPGVTHFHLIGIIAPLIILGGLGYPALHDVVRTISRAFGRRVDRTAPVSLHARTVVIATALLLVIGAAGLAIIESQFGETVLAAPLEPGAGVSLLRESFFTTVAARSTGFHTVDIGGLSDTGKLWLCGLMTIGGGPGGTAGGIKVITLVVLIAAAVTAITGRRSRFTDFNRPSGRALIGRAAVAAVFHLLLLGFVTACLFGIDSAETLPDLFFEACSACGNAGLSTGATARLSDNIPYKLLLVAAMFVGKTGTTAIMLGISASAFGKTPACRPEPLLID